MDTFDQEQYALKWKDKYFASLDEQEALEQSFTTQTGLLSDIILLLSKSIANFDPQLETTAIELQKILKEEYSSNILNTSLSNLTHTISEISKTKRQNATQTLSLLHNTISKLQNLNLPRYIKKKIKHYEKIIANGIENYHEYPKLINELVQLYEITIEHYKEAIDKAEPLKKPTLFNNLFATSEIKPDSEIPIEKNRQHFEPDDEQLELAPNNISTRKNANPKDVPDNKKIGQIQSIFFDLLNEVNIPNSFNATAKSLKTQLQQTNSLDELIPSLELSTRLVIDILQHEQTEFSHYLNLINTRLEDIHNALFATQKCQSQSKQNREQLDNAIETQMHKMKDNMANANNMEQLKQNIGQNLDQIISNLEDFRTAENQQDADLSKQLNLLVEKVATIENESKKVQESLETHRQRAMIDHLTQLPNRTAYDEYIQTEYSRWQRYQAPLSMTVADVDFFKKVNDQFGHLAGDKVLRLIAKILKSELRESDFIARYGGEEFIIILPSTDLDTAKHAIEKLRLAVQNCPFHYQKTDVKITMSFGISSFHQGDTIESTFERADKALYKAKHNGRNQISATT